MQSIIAPPEAEDSEAQNIEVLLYPCGCVSVPQLLCHKRQFDSYSVSEQSYCLPQNTFTFHEGYHNKSIALHHVIQLFKAH